MKDDMNQKLKALAELIEQRRNKVINKPVEINRYFMRTDGFEKTMQHKLDKITMGTIADLKGTYFYRIPLPPKVNLGFADDALTPEYMRDGVVDFYLDKFDFVNGKKKVEINMFYKEDRI